MRFTECGELLVANFATCRGKIIDKKTTKDLMNMLRLKETVNWLEKANGVKW